MGACLSFLLCTLSLRAGEANQFLRGDLNADGRFSIADLVAFHRSLVFDTTPACLAAVDFNGDGRIGFDDLRLGFDCLFESNDCVVGPVPPCVQRIPGDLPPLRRSELRRGHLGGARFSHGNPAR